MHWPDEHLVEPSLAGSRHNCYFLLGFGTSTKMLHYSEVLSIASGTITCCFCFQSHSPLNSCCNAYGMHLGILGEPDMVWPHFLPIKKTFL